MLAGLRVNASDLTYIILRALTACTVFFTQSVLGPKHPRPRCVDVWTRRPPECRFSNKNNTSHQMPNTLNIYQWPCVRIHLINGHYKGIGIGA